MKNRQRALIEECLLEAAGPIGMLDERLASWLRRIEFGFSLVTACAEIREIRRQAATAPLPPRRFARRYLPLQRGKTT